MEEENTQNRGCLVILLVVAVPFGLLFWAWLARLLVEHPQARLVALTLAACVCLVMFVRGWLREVAA